MGASGSGKSTLMHCLAGLDRPTCGTVVIDGVELARSTTRELTELRRDKVGFIFQAFNLAAGPHRARRTSSCRSRSPGQQARRRRGSSSSSRPSASATAARTGPSELSGGQQQRVAVARALVSQARRRLRRRADRQPGLQGLGRGARPAAPRRRRVRPDRRDGHPRRRRRGGRRPAGRAGRRARSCATTAGDADESRPDEGGASASVVLRGLGARKLRTALTALAVVLGVAMISGTYVLTDTIDKSFDDVFQTASQGVDVVRHRREAGELRQRPDVPADRRSRCCRRSRPSDGVARRRGRRVPARCRSRTRTATASAPAARRTSSRRTANPPLRRVPLRRGRARRGPPTRSRWTRRPPTTRASRSATRSPSSAVPGAKTYTVVRRREVRRPSRRSAGAAVAITTLPEAQRMAGYQGKVDSISVAGDDGVTPDRAQDPCRRRAARRRRHGAHRQGGGRPAGRRPPGPALASCRPALLVFAGIALFVGAFIIFNTFSITVAQRTRELALLRTLGASRRQVLRSVVLEALVVGFGAAVIGLLGGLGSSPGPAGPVQGLRRRPAGRRARSSSRGRSSSRWSSAPSSRSSRASRPRCAPRAIAPVAALREGLVAQPAGRARPHDRRRAARRARRRAACSSACSAAPRAAARPRSWASARSSSSSASRMLSPLLVRAARGARRAAAASGVRHHRPPGAREHDAQPRPHRGRPRRRS